MAEAVSGRPWPAAPVRLHNCRSWCLAHIKEDPTHLRAVVLAGVLASANAATLLATALDPFTGTWQLNLAKSKLPPPVPRSVVSYIECDGKSVTVREGIVDANGQRQPATVKAAFDGKDYLVVGSPVADAVSYQRIDSYTLKGTSKKGGKVLVHETVVVSLDGRTMTATYLWADAEGKRGQAAAIAQLRKSARTLSQQGRPRRISQRGSSAWPRESTLGGV
jgi:hypothetical protein